MTAAQNDDPTAKGGRDGSGEGSRNEAAPGGRTSPAGEELGPIGGSSYTPGPMGESGGGQPLGAGANGSFASGTYNERGNVTGPDSPAGQSVGDAPAGESQGDDLANRLGGGENSRAGLTGGGAATGSMDAHRSEPAGASGLGAAGEGAPSAGEVGTMGGAGHDTAGSGRPNGGVGPLQAETGSD